MSRLAHVFWPRWYRLLRWLDPAILAAWGRVPIGNVVRFVVPGRQSGRPRPVFLGLLRVGGGWYVGHPDVDCGWTRNLDASGTADLVFRGERRVAVAAELVPPGAERDTVIRATFRQHPFPGTLLYWLSRRHIAVVGRFYRLTAIDPQAVASPG